MVALGKVVAVSLQVLDQFFKIVIRGIVIERGDPVRNCVPYGLGVSRVGVHKKVFSLGLTLEAQG